MTETKGETENAKESGDVDDSAPEDAGADSPSSAPRAGRETESRPRTGPTSEPSRGRFSRRRDRKASGAQGTAETAPAPEDDLPDLAKIEDSLELRETASWLREELVATRIDNAEHLDHLLRIKAEFDNYRKRMLKEQSDVVARAAVSLVESLLPVLDSFDLAMDHPPEELEEDDTFLRGVKAVRTQILDILDKEGLERIDPDGGAEFDPTVHEPVSQSGGGDTAKVSQVLRPGYRFKGRLLRPAMVEVGG